MTEERLTRTQKERRPIMAALLKKERVDSGGAYSSVTETKRN